MPPQRPRCYRFSDVEVDESRASVTRGGKELHLRPKTFQVLLYLLEHPQRLVSKDELIESVWEGTAVTDDALVKCVGDIRKALGDDPRRPTLIKTVSKGGYRFIGDIEQLVPDAVGFQLEEITTVELEYEEDDTSLDRAPGPASATASAVSLASVTRRPVVLASLLLAAVAVTAAVVVSLKPGRALGLAPAADVTLPSVPGRRAVAVMYFENRSSKPDMDWLSEGLADMLITTLSDSDQLTVLSRWQLHVLLERAGHLEGAAIRLDEALDAARKSRADVVALGSFASLGAKVRVDVALHDVADGRVLASDFLVADEPGEILSGMDLLARKLAVDLGAVAEGATGSMRLAETMTSDLGAYRDYSLALEQAQGLRNAEAITLLKKAIAADPGFAMAHARIGYVYCMRWASPEKAREHLEEAYRHADRLTDKDRRFIVAWYAVANLDYARAIQAFREIVAGYPLEVEAYAALAGLLEGESRGEEAIDVAKQGLSVDPESPELFNLMGSGYLGLGRRDDAIAAFERYVALAPEEPNAHDSLGLAYQWFGLYEEAIAEYERALALDPRFEVALAHLGNSYAQTGRYGDAIASYRKYVEIAPSNVERSRGFHHIAEVLIRKNDRPRAREAARRAIALSESPLWLRFEFAVLNGDLARAERAEPGPNDPYFANRGRRFTERVRLSTLGRLELERGNREEAIRLFETALRQPLLVWALDPLEDVLAAAYLETGRIDEAIAEYERILAINARYPLARYHLAQAYERRNDPARAAVEYRRFLESWSTADSGIPEIDAAREKLAIL